LICSRVAFGYFSSTATVATTKPGVQKPHIRASTSQKACCTGWSVVPVDRPSTVRICLPCTSIARVEHAYTVRPSTIIVHAPHVPRSHTRLLPVRSARFISGLSSVTRGSIFRSTRLPFTVSVTGTSPGPTTRGPVCAATSGTATVVTAVAKPDTPALFKKSLRLTLMRGIIARYRRSAPAFAEGFGGVHRSSASEGGRLGERVNGGYMRARRDFLRQVLPIGAATVAALKTDWLERVVSAGAAAADRPPAEIAADEGYWREIQQ